MSKDFNHNPHSSIFDATQTQVVKGKFSRVLSWYDNEWGFSNRMCDTAIQIANLILIVFSASSINFKVFEGISDLFLN